MGNDSEELKMTVSGIFVKDGKKAACVVFEDGDRHAEGFIPECRISISKGFSEEEVAALETYMRAELEKLKRMAASVDLIAAMVREEKT